MILLDSQLLRQLYRYVIRTIRASMLKNKSAVRPYGASLSEKTGTKRFCLMHRGASSTGRPLEQICPLCWKTKVPWGLMGQVFTWKAVLNDFCRTNGRLSSDWDWPLEQNSPLSWKIQNAAKPCWTWLPGVFPAVQLPNDPAQTSQFKIAAKPYAIRAEP